MSPTTIAVSRTTSLPVALKSVHKAPEKINTVYLENRIAEVMAHTTRYAFKGTSRLASDAGVSKSAVCRLLNRNSSPSYALVVAITHALEKQVKCPLDPRDLVSLGSSYLTRSTCELVGCRGCALSLKATPDPSHSFADERMGGR